MKTPSDPDNDALLAAMLADESWAALDASLRQNALASLRRKRLRYQCRTWTVVGCLAAVALVTLLFRGHTPPVQPENSRPRLTSVIIGSFTDDQLLALFPKGSCIVAEVNGHPKFIVLDEKLAAQGITAQ